MANLTFAAMTPHLKEFYDSARVADLTGPTSALFDLVPKQSNAGGKYFTLPCTYSTVAHSRTFATALAAKRASARAEFQIPYIPYYSIAAVDIITIRASMSDAHAFIAALESEIDLAMKAAARDVAAALYRARGGSVANVLSTWAGASTSLSLASKWETLHFQVGDAVVGAASDTGALRDSGDSVTITAIDRDAGTLTAAANWDTTISGLVASDFLFHAGNAYNNGTGTYGMVGLGTWCPSSVASDTLYDVARSADSLLSGHRLTGSGSIREDLIDAAGLVFDSGNGPVTHFLMHGNDFRAMEKELEGAVVYDRAKRIKDAEIGWDGIKVTGAGGTAVAIPDPFCPQGVVFGVNMPSLILESLGEPVGFIDEGSDNGIARVYNEDAVEIRCGGYLNLGVKNTASVVRIALA